MTHISMIRYSKHLVKKHWPFLTPSPLVTNFRANVEAALKQVITTANSTNSLRQIGACS